MSATIQKKRARRSVQEDVLREVSAVLDVLGLLSFLDRTVTSSTGEKDIGCVCCYCPHWKLDLLGSLRGMSVARPTMQAGLDLEGAPANWRSVRTSCYMADARPFMREYCNCKPL